MQTDTRVIGTRKEAEKYDASHGKKVCIVSQTTFNYNKFQELVEIINKKGYDIIVLNTICNATEERQTEARDIAARGGCHDCHRWQEQFQYAEAI